MRFFVRGLPTAAFLSCLMGVVSPAVAEIILIDNGQDKVSATLKAEAGYFTTQNTSFGGAKNRYWTEYYVKPGIKASHNLDDGKQVYGGASIIGSGNTAGGDPTGFTKDSPDNGCGIACCC